jgi:hypothetical protein
MLGGTAWMFILATYAFFAGEWRIGASALGAGLCVVGLVIELAPWKHPTTQFWKLFLPPVAVMILAAGVSILWAGQSLSPLDWAPALLVGFFMCLFTGIGRRRWEDGNAGK